LAPSSSSASSFDIPQRRNAGGRGHRRGAIGWGVLVYGAILLTCLLLVDQGNTLERHGGFNQLLFLIFFLPCLVLSLAVRCCWRGLSRRAFVWLWVGLACSILLFGHVRFERGRALWPLGLGDSRMEKATLPTAGEPVMGCRIPPPERNWEDVPPNGFMNFWAGSQTCPAQDTFAWLDESNEVLTVDCSKAETGLLSRLMSSAGPGSGPYSFRGAPQGTVYLLPRMEALSWLEKGIGEIALQRWMLGNVLNFTYPGHPVNLHHLERLRDSSSNDAAAEAVTTTLAGMDAGELDVLRSRLDFAAEALLVSCGRESNLIFRNVRNGTAVERVRKHSSEQAQASELVPEAQTFPKKLNVMVVYLDAVSRRQLHRKMPETVSFLEEIYAGKWHNNVSSVFQFFNYHAIGSITKLNMRAMYMGHVVKDLLQTSYRAIWDHFRDNGYVTGLSDNECEDKVARLANTNTTWDHQFLSPFCLPEYLPVGDPHGNWVGPFALKARCMYGKHVHQWVLDYFAKFWRSYADVPRFGIAAFIEGHEGTGEVINLVDTDLASFLRDADLIDYNSTVVFLVSDHGHHMSLWWTLHAESAVRENALPLLHMIAPNWVLRQYPHLERNLLANQQRLVTSFDFHATLRHILLGEAVDRPEWQNKLPIFMTAKSLFGEIDPHRDCPWAGIPPNMCQCR
jgi:hypothetical protein